MSATPKAPCGCEFHGIRPDVADCGCGWGQLCGLYPYDAREQWQADYERVAAAYEKHAGEPLVAGWDWVKQIFEICKAAVECDPSLDEDVDVAAETADRAAAAIATITYGTPRTETP